jgi:hypothetical protein
MKTNTKRISGLVLFLIMFISSSIITGQTTFQKIYSSTKGQSGRDVVSTADGGYIIVGLTIGGDSDIYIVKTNNIGDILWTKTYGGAKPDYPRNIIKTTDSTYLIIGFTKSYGGGKSNTYLLKINAVGDTLWTKTYGGTGYEEGHEIQPTSDGNYIISGSSDSQNPGNFDAYLMKINPSGGVLWTKYYGGSSFETANSVKQSLDGGYIFTGQTYSYGAGQGDIWLVKTDKDGVIAWTKTYGGALLDEGNSVLANADGTYIVCSETNSFGAGDIDVYVISTDASGNKLWDKTYGGSSKEVSHMINPTLDGNYIIAAITRSFGLTHPDMWLLKINNTAGDTLWTVHYGGAQHEHCYSARQTDDGGYIAVGHSDSYSANTEIMFLKLNSLGKLGPLGVGEFSMADNSILLYPNPSSGSLQIDFSNKITEQAELTVSNLVGQIVYSTKINVGEQSKSIDLKGREAAIYFLNLKSKEHTIAKKIILE